jgi:phage/plasmid-associated DNA primase
MGGAVMVMMTSFDIRDFSDKLIRAKGANRYHCPVCNNNNFTIEPKTGKYKCWNDCHNKAIRDAISPPQKKQARPKQTRYWEYPACDGSRLVRVVRIDKGDGSKRIWQERWQENRWVKGLGDVKRHSVPIYRYSDVVKAIAQGKTIFIVEGEPCADTLWQLGIPATTNIGGSGKWLESDTNFLTEADIVLCPDRDLPGVEHMEKISFVFPQAKWLLAFPDSPTWKNLPDRGGLDVADWVADYKLNAEDIQKSVIDTEAFRAKLESHFTPVSTESKKKQTDSLPPASDTAARLAETYRDKLAWESEYQIWRHYGAKHDGVWSEETPESVRGLVHAYLRSLPSEFGFSAGYVSSVVTILQSDLEVKEWNEQKGLLALQDGVLDLETKELMLHAPGYRFTWQLPFKWEDRGVGCQPIEEFLLKITGNPAIAEVLLAFLSAIVTRRSDLQRYLELIGGGGTGKSTFMALAKALAGEENVVSSQLKLLESNQFETAKFYRKLLVLFPDAERWQGEVSVLKQLTGQDPIRYERKGIQQCKDYVYVGMVILSANEPPESSDRTSGQERRKLSIGLDNCIPEYEGRNLAEEFKPFLPGLLKRVLEISRERVTALIKYTERNVPALARKKCSQLIETNPIAAWVDECIVLDPNAKTYIGKDDPEQSARWLYANFCKYQRETGYKSLLPVKRFSANLRDLLKNQLRISINEGRDRNGSFIQGIGLRCDYDPNGDGYTRPITGEAFCDGFEGECDASVTAETIGSDGCDGCDGFLQPQPTSEKNTHAELPDALTPAKVDECLEECNENPSHPSHPSPVSVSPVANASHELSQPVTKELRLPVVATDELESWDDSSSGCDPHQSLDARNHER